MSASRDEVRRADRRPAQAAKIATAAAGISRRLVRGKYVEASADTSMFAALASRNAVTALPDANPLYWRNCAGVPA
jgi:hypothetical protein